MKSIELVDHPGYILYEDGRLYNSNRNHWFKMSEVRPCLHRYCIQGKKYFVHTLVGRSFLDNYEPGLLICHKDETLPLDKLHHVNNLWVGTQQDNMRDCWEKGRGRPKPKQDPITGRFRGG